MQKANKIIKDARGPVGIHCRAGVGRTGTMLAAYLLCTNNKMSVNEAIRETRARRYPIHAIETKSQEKSLQEYKEYLCKY